MARLPGRTTIAAIALVAIVSAPVFAGDGRQRWFSIESAHFVVHYYRPLDAVARKVAAAAEKSHQTLALVFEHEPESKTHIVLNDMTDGANGFASVIPRNTINLFVTAPTGLSALNDHDDWLYDLTAHEYVHILHLDSIGGLPYLYNRIFGKTWSPNQNQPRWVIEGIATHEESKRSAAGRTRSALFEMELRVAVLAGQAMPLDRMSSGARVWPHGTVPYLYGSHFLKYVFDRFGEDKISKMSWSYGSNPVPFALNRSIKDATGETFETLYEDWLSYMRAKYSSVLQGIERRGRIEGRRITFSGEGTANPRHSPSGEYVVFRESDGFSRGRFLAVPTDSNAADVFEYAIIDRAGGFDVMSDGSLVVEQTANYRTNYSWQDLFLWSRQDERMTRLTRGLRARDPILSPDERRVAFRMNDASHSSLAVIPLRPEAKPTILWTGDGGYDQAYSPSWSADGRWIAFSAWQDGGYRDILLYDFETKTTTAITSDRAIDADPRFSPDGKYVFFSSDRTGVYNLFAYELATARLMQVTNVLGGAFTPTVSPDGKKIVYQGFDVGGYDLYEIEVDESRWLAAEPYIDDRPDPVVIRDTSQATNPEPYRPLTTLGPRSYEVAMTSNTLGNALTVSTDGRDVVGWHAYRVAVTLGLDEANVAFSGNYSYTRLWPGFRAAISRNAARRGGVVIDGRNTLFIEEVLGATAGVSLPVMRHPTATASLSFDYDFDWLRNTEDEYDEPDPNDLLPRFPETDVKVTGVGLRFNYRDSRGFRYTIGSQEGKVLALSMRLNQSELGGDFESLDLSYRFEWYRALPFSPTSAFSSRFSGGIRTSNRSRTGIFVLGGVPEQDIVNAALNNLRFGGTGYLRGFPERTIFGPQFHLANFELRQQLLNVEHGLSTVPVYLRRFHLAALVDVGDAFDGSISPEDFNVSVGGAVRADFVLAYFVPGTLDIGYSRGLTTDGVGEYWMLLTGTL